jgi:hypothetical protein
MSNGLSGQNFREIFGHFPDFSGCPELMKDPCQRNRHSHSRPACSRACRQRKPSSFSSARTPTRSRGGSPGAWNTSYPGARAISVRLRRFSNLSPPFWPICRHHQKTRRRNDRAASSMSVAGLKTRMTKMSSRGSGSGSLGSNWISTSGKSVINTSVLSRLEKEPSCLAGHKCLPVSSRS